MPDLAAGTITFLFTDIEGSTRLLQELGDEYAVALADQRALLRSAFAKRQGAEVDAEGDSLFFAFSRAGDAIAAATDGQRALTAHEWPRSSTLRVRMGLHTGEPAIGQTGYVGIDVHRAARIASAAHGGQVLLSETTHVLGADSLPPGVGVKDLGEHRLKDLQRPEHLFQLVIPDLPSDFLPLRSLNAVPNNLPTQLTTFVGRADTLAEAKRLLDNTRLLTLTGTGGTGKTRLSLQLAADALEAFPAGVWLIELAQLTDPALIAQTIATVLGVREVTGRPLMVALIDYMRDKDLLLILDNCEHMIDACARLADDLLRSCPRLKILASSREALGIAGEVSFRVPSLKLPTLHPTLEDLQQCESARLFIERARAVQPRFAVTSQNTAAISQICWRLDGIPLALELAAARVNVLTVEQIASRLNDRFRLLTGGSRTAMPRQQTLRAAIDWSFDLLSEPERTLLRRLSVFMGGWNFEAAEQVTANGTYTETQVPMSSVSPDDVLDVLSHLVGKSLVVVDEESQAARYRMLETVRQYARDKLLESGDAPKTHDRHLDYFAQFARQAAQGFDGPDVFHWLSRCELEHDNLRAAFAWALDMHPEAALELTINLGEFWEARGLSRECQSWLDDALTRVQALPLVEGEAARQRAVLVAKGELTWGHSALVQGEHMALTREKLQACLALARQIGDEWLIARAVGENAFAAIFDGDAKVAGPLAYEGVARMRKIGDVQGLARALIIQAQFLSRLGGSYEQARASLDESIRMLRARGVTRELAIAQFGFAYLALHHRKDYAAAKELFQEGLVSLRRLGDRHFANMMRSGVADAARLQGDYAEAVSLYQECLTIWQEFGHRGAIARVLECLGFIAGARGGVRRAVRLIGAADALRAISDSQMTTEERPEYEQELAALRAKVDADAFQRDWSNGHDLTTEQAIALAFDERAVTEMSEHVLVES